MAELVSIRSSDGKGENKIATQESVTNPAYSDDFETAQSTPATNGKAQSSTIKASSLQGTTISFHNVKYTVDIKVKRKKVAKEIVKGIRFVMPYVNKVCKHGTPHSIRQFRIL